MSSVSDNEVTFERPIAARLLVHCVNGDEWEARPEDVGRFGYIDKHTAYDRFIVHMTNEFGQGWMDGPLGSIRHAVECAIHYADIMPDSDEHDELRSVLDRPWGD